MGMKNQAFLIPNTALLVLDTFKNQMNESEDSNLAKENSIFIIVVISILILIISINCYSCLCKDWSGVISTDKNSTVVKENDVESIFPRVSGESIIKMSS